MIGFLTVYHLICMGLMVLILERHKDDLQDLVRETSRGFVIFFSICFVILASSALITLEVIRFVYEWATGRR